MTKYLNKSDILIKKITKEKLNVKFRGINLEVKKDEVLKKEEYLNFDIIGFNHILPKKNTVLDQAKDTNNIESELFDKSTPGYLILFLDGKKIEVQLNSCYNVINN